jgi:hypothetical protein
MAAVLTDRSAAGEQPEMEPRVGLFGDVADELRWTFSGRKGWLIGMALNLVVALVYVAYTHYDPHRAGDIRAVNIGLAVVVWTLADTVNTNQLGADSERASASLESGDIVARILAIKNLALALLLVPLAFAISLVHRVMADRWHLLFHTAMTDVGAVFLWLGVGSVISVLLPYRPISLRAHVKARKTWPRWAICQGVPYGAVFVVVPLLHLPYLALYHLRDFGPYGSHYVYYSLVYLDRDRALGSRPVAGVATHAPRCRGSWRISVAAARARPPPPRAPQLRGAAGQSR